jgi:outer membrane beta-barrel protein
MRAHALPALLFALAVPAAARAAEPRSAEAAGGTGESTAADSADAEGDAATDEPIPATRISCLDDASPEGDPRKGVQRRPFLKRMRVELAGIGGLWASDVLSSTYVYGGAVAFYPSEDFGIEALVTRSPVSFRLEQPFTAFDREERFADSAAWQAVASLLYAPFHAKLKLSEDNILAADAFIVGGVGRTFHDSVQGMTWELGFGLKVYAWSRVSLRFDVRDFVLPQEVLGRGRVTHNLSVLGGLSVWLL